MATVIEPARSEGRALRPAPVASPLATFLAGIHERHASVDDGAVALIVTARSRMQAPRGATAAEPVARVRTEVTAPSTGSG